jgi:hypothetical protein
MTIRGHIRRPAISRVVGLETSCGLAYSDY